MVNVGDDEDVNKEMTLQYDENNDNINLDHGDEVDQAR